METNKKRIALVMGVAGIIVSITGLALMFGSVAIREMEPTPAQSLPPPTKLPHDPIAAIDRMLENMDFGNIAFNAPNSMNLYDTSVIQLKLSLATPIDELKLMIEAEGAKEGARIRVSDRMEARLSGSNFAITAITPETQAVSGFDVTEWKWEIKPASEGRHRLHLTLSALLIVEGTSTPRAIRTFDKVIEVEVKWHQRAGSFFKKNWQWLWAALLIPIAGWLWKRRRLARRRIRQAAVEKKPATGDPASDG